MSDSAQYRRCCKNTLNKLRAVQNQIHIVAEGDFPYADGKDALEMLDAKFSEEISRIEDIIEKDTSLNTANAACAQANLVIVEILPIIGLILRSTNIRNSFELFDPLKRMVRQVLGEGAHLILSSEWEFSPLTYPLSIPELPNFVIIGLPTPESANALIAPLTGHELGHSAWAYYNLADRVGKPLQDEIIKLYQSNWNTFKEAYNDRNISDEDKENIATDLIYRQFWTTSYASAVAQLEEVFCDFFGLKTFGESYLHAFEYMLAPYLGEERSEYYPDMVHRAQFLQFAADKFGIKVAANYSAGFQNKPVALGKKGDFLLEMADRATENLIDLVASLVEEIINSTELSVPTPAGKDRCLGFFKVGVPADGVKNIADILNAAWEMHLTGEAVGNLSFSDQESLPEEDKLLLLNELILKSIEIIEFNTRISTYGTKDG